MMGATSLNGSWPGEEANINMVKSTAIRRPVTPKAREVIAQWKLQPLVDALEELVDRHVPPDRVRGGSVEYFQSMESPNDWDVAVTTKVDLPSDELFDLSLRIGEALNEVIDSLPGDNWLHMTYHLDFHR